MSQACLRRRFGLLHQPGVRRVDSSIYLNASEISFTLNGDHSSLPQQHNGEI